jgi:hypothetical protein
MTIDGDGRGIETVRDTDTHDNNNDNKNKNKNDKQNNDNDNDNSDRWRDLCRDVADEQNPERMSLLIDELITVLDKRRQKFREVGPSHDRAASGDALMPEIEEN